jgi:uncharacterized protein
LQSKPLAAPTAPGERLGAVDILRGFALVGILIFNIDHLSLPSTIYLDPSSAGGFEGVNYWVWVFKYTFINQKFFTQFAMLFGAGVVLMSRRFESREQPMKRWYYRRILVLLGIGLVHAYLIWDGDILVPYAICGLVLYPFRRVRPSRLALLGVALIIFAQVPMVGAGYGLKYVRDKAEQTQAAVDAGEEVRDTDHQMLSLWEGIQVEIGVEGSRAAEEMQIIGHGSWWDIVRYRAPNVLSMHIAMMLLMLFWRISGLMLLGMALIKWGFLSGHRSRRFYGVTALFSYALGLPVSIYSGTSLMEQGFGLVSMFSMEASTDAIGSVLVGMGHVSIVMLLYNAGALHNLMQRLAALGRMALTNYLMHSVVGVIVFYGYGSGLFGQFDRLTLLGIAAVIIALQLLLSPWWLARYRFGPAEWLWRSLTYGWRQPMRARPEPEPTPPAARPA